MIWTDAIAQTYAPPAQGDFGGTGPQSIFVDTFRHPIYPTANGEELWVSVHHPYAVINPALPTIFFAHGFSNPVGSVTEYAALVGQLASHGYNVVFAPYEGGTGLNIPRRFDQLVTGFSAAVDAYALNSTQVGFAGHSYGGGFMPSVIRHLMMNQPSQFRAGRSWGSSAAFLFTMAPGYTFSGGGQTAVDGSQLIPFPANLNVVVQVFSGDNTFVDPRVALDVFYNISTLNSQKDFLMVHSDSHGSPPQVANHFLPNTGPNVPSTSLQAWAVSRHLHALAAWTFGGDTTAKTIALGNGVDAQRFTGLWSDNTPVVPLDSSDVPLHTSLPSGPFSLVQFSSAVNPRQAYPLPEGPPKLGNLTFVPSQVSMTTSGLLVGHEYVVQSSTDLMTWTSLLSFTASQTSQVLNDSLTNNPPRKFWRMMAP